jgi:hypothetical protein
MRLIPLYSTRTVVLLLIGVLSLGVGCDELGARRDLEGEPLPRINDEDIEAFVDKEPLSEVQPARRLMKASSLGVTVFVVSFGGAHDCPSGCFYSTAYGLKVQNRVGWMGLHAYRHDDSLQTKVSRFDVQSRDSTLFGTEIREDFRQAQARSGRTAESAYEVFLEMLAGDQDTPNGALLDIVRLLDDEFHPGTGRALLDNPVVRSSRDILAVLAGLPKRGAYADIRDQARDLLDQSS